MLANKGLAKHHEMLNNSIVLSPRGLLFLQLNQRLCYAVKCSTLHPACSYRAYCLTRARDPACLKRATTRVQCAVCSVHTIVYHCIPVYHCCITETASCRFDSLFCFVFHTFLLSEDRHITIKFTLKTLKYIKIVLTLGLTSLT